MNYKDKTYSIVKLYIVLTGLGPEGWICSHSFLLKLKAIKSSYTFLKKLPTKETEEDNILFIHINFALPPKKNYRCDYIADKDP